MSIQSRLLDIREGVGMIGLSRSDCGEGGKNGVENVDLSVQGRYHSVGLLVHMGNHGVETGGKDGKLHCGVLKVGYCRDRCRR